MADGVKGRTSYNDLINDDTGWIKISDYTMARKKNGIVMVVGGNASGGTPTSKGIQLNVGTLPVGMRPSKQIRLSADATSITVTVSGWIKTDGSIVIMPVSDGTSYFGYSATFFVD